MVEGDLSQSQCVEDYLAFSFVVLELLLLSRCGSIGLFYEESEVSVYLELSEIRTLHIELLQDRS